MADVILLFLILFPLIAACLGFITGKQNEKMRDRIVTLCTGAELIAGIFLLCEIHSGETFIYNLPDLFGLGIYLKMDGFRAIFVVMAAFLWLAVSLIASDYFRNSRNMNRYRFFHLVTLSATIGVFLSADLFTLYVFFEAMTFASFVLVIHNEKPDSIRAAKIYIFFGIIGGMAALLGIILLQSITGSLEFESINQAIRQMTDKTKLLLPGLLIFSGFAVKAGIFPVHVTLPEAYPAAPAPAAALLSGILSKTGVFGIIIISMYVFYHDTAWGWLSLILGMATMIAGALIAIFSINMRKLLAGSSISQIGFILLGIGLANLLGTQNAMAVRGSLLHMVNHSLIKLNLFLIAGIISMNTGEQDLNKIRGFGKGKPLMHICFLSAWFAIAGLPMFCGYVSKTLLHESISEYVQLLADKGLDTSMLQIAEVVFIVAGGMTLAYIMKLYAAIFWEENEDPGRQREFELLNGRYIHKKSSAALLASAIFLPILGSFTKMMDGIADLGQGFMLGRPPEHTVHYFTRVNLKGSLYTVIVGTIIYFLFIRIFLIKRTNQKTPIYIDCWPSWLNLNDRLYIPLALMTVSLAGIVIDKGMLFGRKCAAASKQFVSVTAVSSAEAAIGKLALFGRKFTAAFKRFVSVMITRFGETFSMLHMASLFDHTAYKHRSGLQGESESAAEDSMEIEIKVQVWHKLSGGISYSLLLFGIGVIGIVLYLLDVV